MAEAAITGEDIEYLEKVRVWLKKAPVLKREDGSESHWVKKVEVRNDSLDVLASFSSEDDWWLISVFDEDLPDG